MTSRLLSPLSAIALTLLSMGAGMASTIQLWRIDGSTGQATYVPGYVDFYYTSSNGPWSLFDNGEIRGPGTGNVNVALSGIPGGVIINGIATGNNSVVWLDGDDGKLYRADGTGAVIEVVGYKDYYVTPSSGNWSLFDGDIISGPGTAYGNVPLTGIPNGVNLTGITAANATFAWFLGDDSLLYRTDGTGAVLQIPGYIDFNTDFTSGTWSLFDGDMINGPNTGGTISITGLDSGLTLTGIATGNNAFVWVTAIPEPSATLLLMGSAFLLLRRRR